MLIAINPHLIDKGSNDQIALANAKFENRDIDAETLAGEIKNGYAFCAQHKPGGRKRAGFIAAGYLAVDIDSGLTLEAARADPYFQRYATILYTTPSHSADAHRFRVVFELEQPITDPERMKQALTGLTARFGGDSACVDACRMFFGSTASTPEVYGNKLPVAEVESLLVRAQERRVDSDTTGEEASRRRSPVRSRINIPLDTVVRSDRGVVALLSETPSGTRIFCPQHVDKRPSAITLRNKSGNPGLSCSACNATFFLEDGSGRRSLKPYRFDYHWNAVLNVSHEQYEAYADEDGHVNVSQIYGGRVQVLNKRHLPFDELVPTVVAAGGFKFNEDDVRSRAERLALHFDIPDATATGLITDTPLTLIRSPKGTGKTEWLGRLVKMFRGAGVSVLLIGHRRALITATAHRVGLTSYLGELDSETDVGRQGAAPTSHYAICVDSLPRMDPSVHHYDVVLIDEVEQVFAHLLADTLKEGRREALHTLRHYLKTAKALYVLDADLSSVTVELLHAVFGAESPAYQAIINQWQPTGRTVHLYDGSRFDVLAGELAASLNRRERCFVCSNSKKLIEELHSGLVKQVTRPLRTLLITSENSQKADIQAIIRDIKTKALDYDAIFTSPALGTGIDITFEDDAQEIDAVFGFFRARINTHFDIDQQLARVRNPKRICVWISPEEFTFESDSEAIKAELLLSEAQHRQFLRIDPDGTKVYDQDEFYDTVFSTVTASQRASKNRLRHNFIELRRSNGWTVEVVGADESLSDAGQAVAKHGKTERRRIEFERLLSARQISAEDYDGLRQAADADRLREADIPSMRRYEIEAFYLMDATMYLLEEDDEHRLRSAVLAYENLVASDDELRRRDQYAESSLIPDKPQHLLKKHVLRDLLQAAHVMRSGVFDRTAVIDASMQGAFATYCLKHKAQIERLFEVSVRQNTRRDPIRQLQGLLSVVGLSVVKDRRDQSDGASRTFYRLSEERLDRIEGWAQRRRDADLRESWKHGRTSSPTSSEPESQLCAASYKSVDPLDPV